jgi:DNA-binding MarR family transcriptional regulator
MIRLYSVLRANPTISLGEAANKIGCSRKSVAVWIKTLIAKEYVIAERRATSAFDQSSWRFPMNEAPPS